MKKVVVFILGSLFLSTLAVGGCKKDEDPGAQNPQPLQPNQYPTAQTTAPPPTATPTATTTGTGASPMPFSMPCSTPEGTCGHFKCNMQAGRCAFPCTSNADCITGAACMGIGTPMAACVPSMGATTPPPSQ
jgi:hypothetical protein